MCSISLLVPAYDLATAFNDSYGLRSVCSESLLMTIPAMSSAAQVTVCAANTQSMQDGAASFPTITASSVNAVSHDPNFKPTSSMARCKPHSASLSAAVRSELVSGVVQELSELNSIAS